MVIGVVDRVVLKCVSKRNLAVMSEVRGSVYTDKHLTGPGTNNRQCLSMRDVKTSTFSPLGWSPSWKSIDTLQRNGEKGRTVALSLAGATSFWTKTLSVRECWFIQLRENLHGDLERERSIVGPNISSMPTF